jgi:hypothetical protein
VLGGAELEKHGFDFVADRGVLRLEVESRNAHGAPFGTAA